MRATDRLRSASGGKNVPFAPRKFGRIGYDTPVAQPTIFRLKSHHTDGVNTIADETNSIFVGDYAPHSHTGTWCAVDTSSCDADGLGGDNTVDDPGGGINDPGGGTF